MITVAAISGAIIVGIGACIAWIIKDGSGQ